MGKAAVQVLINCNCMNFIVIVAVHLLVFVLHAQLRRKQRFIKAPTPYFRFYLRAHVLTLSATKSQHTLR